MTPSPAVPTVQVLATTLLSGSPRLRKSRYSDQRGGTSCKHFLRPALALAGVYFLGLPRGSESRDPRIRESVSRRQKSKGLEKNLNKGDGLFKQPCTLLQAGQILLSGLLRSTPAFRAVGGVCVCKELCEFWVGAHAASWGVCGLTAGEWS